MQQFGVYEAKTKLPDLIRQALDGARITITNRGVAMVDLVPSAELANQRTAKAINAIQMLRANAASATNTLIDQTSFTALRTKGRR